MNLYKVNGKTDTQRNMIPKESRDLDIDLGHSLEIEVISIALAGKKATWTSPRSNLGGERIVLQVTKTVIATQEIIKQISLLHHNIERKTCTLPLRIVVHLET